MAVGYASPFSVALLWFYAKTLDLGGPSYALYERRDTNCIWIDLRTFNHHLKMDETNCPLANAKLWDQTLLFLLFLFQNAYVQLSYVQHWTFISSVLAPEEGTKAFAPIAGLGSIGSTIAAGLVSVLVERVGLIGLLHMAGASYVVSALLADVAFETARMGGYEPRGGGNKYDRKDSGDERDSGNNKNNIFDWE